MIKDFPFLPIRSCKKIGCSVKCIDRIIPNINNNGEIRSNITNATKKSKRGLKNFKYNLINEF
ncbi:hypothetical protein GCM10008088_26080 [Mesonia mobilis]|uniref:Uncharacterized protein n=1 Tax=Mesonia mobilis TaxID=369791 RepID=A0ABQ3C630_9FLAO|nr:hypothetical protein GCM10008088_26080 [Mesonia mobilis]